MATWAIGRVNGKNGIEGMKVTIYFIALAFFCTV
jgi:hypothetical protein